MRGYWHFAAIAAAVSILTIYFHSYLFIVGFFLWLFYLYYCHQLAKLPIIISFIFFLFFFIYIPNIDTAPSLDKHMAADDAAITGKIVRPPSVTEKKIEWLLQEEESNHKIAVVFFPDTEAGHQKNYPAAKYGSRCIVNGKLELPSPARNPGQFDFQKYLLQQGISSQMILSSPEDMKCTGTPFLHKIFSSRIKLMDHIEASFSKYTSAWLNGLVFGDDSGIDEDVTGLFQKWSLSHILAISGLHVGLVVGLLYLLLVKLNIVTKEKAEWLMICFLPFYVLLAGGEPSVKRACGMVLLFIILNKIKLRFSVTDTLSIVFLLLIIFDKFIVYHAGFQLSFAVTFGLMLSRRWINQSDFRFVQILQVSFVSQLMILPLQFAYFSTFQPLSIVLNVIVVPYFTLFVIPFMFFLLPFSFLPLPVVVTDFFDQLFIRIHRVFVMMLEKVDTYADFPFIIGDISMEFAVIYYVLFFIFMRHLQRVHISKAFVYGCCLSLLICSMAVRPYLSPVGRVTMLDIGQGDAYVIELPYRKGVIFMDAGANFSFDDFQPDEKVYEYIIKPYLYSRGISKVDAAFLSHEDIDHMGSIPYMIEDIGIDEIIISDHYELDKQTALQWKAHGAHLRRLSHNDGMSVGGQHFQAVAPVKEMNSPNENSLVLFTELGGKRWLFTGDAGVPAEKEIMKIYPNLAVDILKAGHHGSDTSTSEAFVNQLQPDYALISAGENNAYGHPAKKVLETLENEGVQIFRTDHHGAVQFRFTNEEGTFSKYLP